MPWNLGLKPFHRGRALPVFLSGLFAFAGMTSVSGQKPITADAVDDTENGRYVLVWEDNFDADGRPDSTKWNYEHGFVRNEEEQWYQPENAECRDGMLVITGRHETVKNPFWNEYSLDWRSSRREASYTSASLNTRGKFEFQYGKVVVRARIPVCKGAWPAIWTLGRSHPWPSCGEVDIMEFYHIDGVPHLLANVACGGDRVSVAKWHTETRPYRHFQKLNPYWDQSFHVWEMCWNADSIRLLLDGELMNVTLLKDTRNGRIGGYDNPFRTPQYLLLNLALGGRSGGPIGLNAFPMHYEIDYVRVYQLRKGAE